MKAVLVSFSGGGNGSLELFEIDITNRQVTNEEVIDFTGPDRVHAELSAVKEFLNHTKCERVSMVHGPATFYEMTKLKETLPNLTGLDAKTFLYVMHLANAEGYNLARACGALGDRVEIICDSGDGTHSDTCRTYFKNLDTSLEKLLEIDNASRSSLNVQP